MDIDTDILKPGEIETLEPIDDVLDDQDFIDGLVRPFQGNGEKTPRKYHIR